METLFCLNIPFGKCICKFSLLLCIACESVENKSFSNFTTKQSFYQEPRSHLWDANIKEVSHCVCQVGAWVLLTSNSRLHHVKREHSHVCPQIWTISKLREIPQVSSEFTKNNVRLGCIGVLA